MSAPAARIAGIDVARGLAVLGMFTAHLGHDVGGEPAPEWLVVADGRSAALFAVLAGVSVALFTGRRTPPTGVALRLGRARVLTRAAFILGIGALLMALGTPVAVILPSYAVTFLLLLPAIGLRPRLVVVLAVGAAVVGPLLVALMTVPPPGGENWLTRTIGFDQDLVLDLVVTGYYPALIWVAYMLLGLAVGRLDLAARRVQLTLVGAGTAMAVAGYVVADRLMEALGWAASALAVRLVRAEPHDDSTLELLGNSGVALAVLGGCLLLTTAPGAGRAVRVLLTPLAATGATALSAYSFHIVAIALLGDEVVFHPGSNAPLLGFVLVTLVAATAWQRWLGRGPLERLMRAVTVGPAPLPAPVPARAGSGSGNP
jgi:uncharacterized protein